MVDSSSIICPPDLGLEDNSVDAYINHTLSCISPEYVQALIERLQALYTKQKRTPSISQMQPTLPIKDEEVIWDIL